MVLITNERILKRSLITNKNCMWVWATLHDMYTDARTRPSTHPHTPHTQTHTPHTNVSPSISSHERLWTPSGRRALAALLVLAVAAAVSNAQEYNIDEVIRNLQTRADAEELVRCVLDNRSQLPCRQMFLDFRREFNAPLSSTLVVSEQNTVPLPRMVYNQNKD